MARVVFIAIDLDAEDGEKFAPEVRAEIAAVAPSLLVNGAVTTVKLRDLAVTLEKLADGAVTSPKIAAGGVKAVNIDTGAVTSDKIDAGAVTAPKAGVGVVTAHDSSGTAITVDIVPITAADYAALSSPNPNVLYAELP
ncbi:phage upper tail fiber protein [Mycobacterium sp. LTG2003]